MRDELTPPAYEITKTIEDTDQRTVQIVKLSKPHVARLFSSKSSAKLSFADVDTVKYSAVRLQKQDAHGSFVYEETTLQAVDDTGAEVAVFLYMVPRRLSVEEALFAIGEI